MNLIIKICAVLTLVSAISAADYLFEDQTDLIQVSVITRHGQRTPKEPFPSDPWRQPKYWPEGWMQLTQIGMGQLRELGEWLKERYSNLLPSKFVSGNIFARSTDTDRTLASAFALMTGLYPGEAVPIHSAPLGCDSLFPNYKSCPAYDEEMQRFLNTPEEIEKEDSRKKLYAWLTRQLGRTVKSLAVAESLYTCFLIEEERNLTLPRWTKDVYPEALRALTGEFLARGSATPLLSRLRFGSLLKDIINNAKKAHIADQTRKRLLLYSGHDFTIVGILNSLKIFDGLPVQFAAALIFEIRSSTSPLGNTIKIFYRVNSTSDAIEQFIPGCENPCHINRLEDIVDHILPKDLKVECDGVDDAPLFTAARRDGLILAAAAIGAASLGAVVVVCFSRVWQSNDRAYLRLLEKDLERREAYITLAGTNSPRRETM